MIKSRINKKKIRINSILKFTLSIILIIMFAVAFQQFYKSDLAKKKLLNIIEIFSQNNEYLLKEIKINKLNHIDHLEIKKYFSQYYDRSIFATPQIMIRAHEKRKTIKMAVQLIARIFHYF